MMSLLQAAIFYVIYCVKCIKHIAHTYESDLQIYGQSQKEDSSCMHVQELWNIMQQVSNSIYVFCKSKSALTVKK